MPSLVAMAPMVRHLLLEHAAGVPVEHVLWEAGMEGYLMGYGLSPGAAERAVEAMESLGVVPGVASEMAAAQLAVAQLRTQRAAGMVPVTRAPITAAQAQWLAAETRRGPVAYGVPTTWQTGRPFVVPVPPY